MRTRRVFICGSWLRYPQCNHFGGRATAGSATRTPTFSTRAAPLQQINEVNPLASRSYHGAKRIALVLFLALLPPPPASPPERLTTDPAQDFAPDPSPDGRSVVFHSPRGASRDLYLLPLDGGALRKLTDTPQQQELMARWSPDGQRILYQDANVPGQIEQLASDGKGGWPRRPFRLVGSWPSWSPDGRWIAYATNLFGGGLRVTSPDTVNPRALYDETAPGAPLAETSAWSADGRTVYFKSHTPEGDYRIMAVPTSGGVPRVVMRLGDDRLRAGRYGFRIVGGYIYYALQDQQANVSVAEVGKGRR